MGLIDTTFAPLPTALLADWGQNITYIKTTTPRTYNPTTGAVTGADTNVTVKAVISRLSAREAEGLYQTTDLKVIIGTDERKPTASSTPKPAPPAKPKSSRSSPIAVTTPSCTPSS
jgi:hypothetical protein